MKIVLKNSSIVIKGVVSREISAIQSVAGKSIDSQGKITSSGLRDMKVYPVARGKKYIITLSYETATDVGVYKTIALCKCDGVYNATTTPVVYNADLANYAVSSSKTLTSFNGEFEVTNEMDADCIIVSYPKTNYGGNATINVLEIG